MLKIFSVLSQHKALWGSPGFLWQQLKNDHILQVLLCSVLTSVLAELYYNLSPFNLCLSLHLLSLLHVQSYPTDYYLMLTNYIVA